MGCLFSWFSWFFGSSTASDIVETPPVRQPYSWERADRAAVRKEDFILDALKDQTIFRLPGAVSGQQFIIQNCENCTVYVFDHTGQVQIDDCKDCRIFIGPVHGSIFLRDSVNIVLATICQQFRTRDCHDAYIYLSCASQPIIESSHNIKFGCLTLNYENLINQYKAADISPWNNNWGHIHDFTRIPDGKNYALIDKAETVSQHLPIPTDPSCSHLNCKDDFGTSVTPYTYGELYRNRNDERCLVIFFQDANADDCARALIAIGQNSDIVLVQTKSYKIDESSAGQMFGGDRKYVAQVAKGPVIGLEFAGPNCVSICHQNLHTVITTKYPNIPHFISETPNDARIQLDKFYNFASMQMFA